MAVNRTKLRPVRPGEPCPVCGRTKSCSVGEDGFILCIGSKGDVPGFVSFGPSKAKPEFHGYRREGDPALYKNNGNGYTSRTSTAQSQRPRPAASQEDWDKRVKRLVDALVEHWKAELAQALGLPRCCLDALPGLGFKDWDRKGHCWTFPEVNGKGQVVGYLRRWPNGDKYLEHGSKPGLTVPLRWQERDGPIYIVEGASDVLALTALGLSAIGRPSAAAGVDELAELLASSGIAKSSEHASSNGSPAQADEDLLIHQERTALGPMPSEPPVASETPSGSPRPIVVLAEVDFRANGAWPGLEGAQKIATELSKRLGRPVAWSFTPDRAKDARAWLLAQAPALNLADELEALGVRFTASVRSNYPDVGGNTPSKTELALTMADKEPDQVVGWMVPKRIPKARLCLLSGDGGKGKSQILSHVAAMVTQGQCWFGLSYPEPTVGEVIMAIGEDGLGDTAKARLRSAGARLDRVHFIRPRVDSKGNPIPFDLSQLLELRNTLDAHPGVKLVTIDPIAAYLGGAGGDGNNDPKLRAVLDPLQDVAIATGVTVLVSGHFNKSIAATVKQRVSGSVAFRNVPRSLLVCLDDSECEDGFILCWDKLSYAPEPDSIRYGIILATPEELPRLQAGLEGWSAELRAAHAEQLTRIEWRGEDRRKGNAIAGKEAAGQVQAAGEVAELGVALAAFLDQQPRLGSDCVAKLKEQCGTSRSYRWLKEQILIGELSGRVEKTKEVPTRSIWCLPGQTGSRLVPDWFQTGLT